MAEVFHCGFRDHAQIIVVNDEHVAMWRFGSVEGSMLRREIRQS
ncbi:hypothetical protein PAMC26510_25750 [Caballeronia sordidicola]|uniref:Uncharacterized protein n=1 Tax=Caballeronia sordidicola TaxID=196367 RepID=A0A242MG87_CABSO|nr:hypothetical protein PAMC26510_25750 [Caballeronia sordidicola]